MIASFNKYIYIFNYCQEEVLAPVAFCGRCNKNILTNLRISSRILSLERNIALQFRGTSVFLVSLNKNPVLIKSVVTIYFYF